MKMKIKINFLLTKNREMKQLNISLFVKDLSIRFKREVREGSIHFTITIILCLSMASFVAILGILTLNHIMKYLSSEDPYFPQLGSFTPVSSWSPYAHFFNTSSPSSPSLPIFQPPTTSWVAPVELWHSMSDEELL